MPTTTGLKGISRAMAGETNSKTDEIQVNRARLGAITLYDVTEEELEIIERGSPSSNYLNFAIALLSVAISFCITLLTTKIEDDRTFNIFVIVCIVSAIAGIFLLFMWWRTSASSKDIFKRIRSRKNPEEVRAVIESDDEQVVS